MKMKLKNLHINLLLNCKLGDIIILSGDLGAGKTKFTEGFLSFWNLEEEISSPTFTIVNEYSNANINIFHFDVYRLEDSDEFFAIGGLEYFEKGICIIEWGELIEDILPKNYIKIELSKDLENPNIRFLKLTATNDRLQAIIESF